MNIQERRQRICRTCQHLDGSDHCDLTAEWVKLSSMLAVPRNACRDGHWGPWEWVEPDPVLVAKDLALCEWREDGVRDENGLVVACDRNQEWLLRWWLKNMRLHNPNLPVVLADIGLTEGCREEMIAAGLEVVPFPCQWSQEGLRKLSNPLRSYFLKPMIILNSPFSRTVWMDLDVKVKGSLDGLFDYADGFRIRPELEWPKTVGWGKPRLGEVMYQAGIIVTRHGDPLAPAWAKYAIKHWDQGDFVHCDQSALARMAYDMGVRLDDFPPKYHGFAIDDPTEDEVCRHYYGGYKREIRKELKLLRVAVYGGDAGRNKTHLDHAALAVSRLGCEVSRCGRSNLPACDILLVWNGLRGHCQGLLDAAASRGVRIFYGELGLLDQSRYSRWDEDGVNAGASWARQPIDVYGETRLDVTGQDVLVVLQCRQDTQIVTFCPHFDSLAAWLRHMAAYCVLPMRVRAHPKEAPNAEAQRIVDGCDNMRWDDSGSFADAMNDAMAVATINSTTGVEAMVTGLPVLCYGDAVYRHAPAAYCMDSYPGSTTSVTQSLADGSCELTHEAQDEIVARCREHDIPTARLGEWFRRNFGMDEHVQRRQPRDSDTPKPNIDAWERSVAKRFVMELPKRRTYLEIGGFVGGSLTYFGQCMEKGSLLVSVERPSSPSDIAKLMQSRDKLTGMGYDARVVVGDSTDPETLSKVLTILDGIPVDVLLIDGGHEIAEVASDVSKYARLVRKGGIVMMHDAGSHASKSDLSVWDGYRLSAGINAVWRDLADKKRSLLLQQTSGLGLVWM